MTRGGSTSGRSAGSGTGQGAQPTAGASRSGSPRGRSASSETGHGAQLAAGGSRGDRKAATHERILRAAIELFLTHGYKRSSIGAVAEQAGVSRSAVFWHFGTKAELFHQICRELLVPFREAMEHNLQHLDPRKRLYEVVDFFGHFEEQNRATIEQFVRWFYGDELPQGPLRRELLSLQGVFLRDVEEALIGLGEDPEDAASLAAALVSLLDGNLLLRLIDPSPEAAARRRAGVEAMLERILAAPGRRG